MELTMKIDPELWPKATGYRRVIITCTVSSAGAAEGHAEIRAALPAAQRGCISRLSEAHDLVEVPAIAAWRTAFRSMGINPGKYRPAAEALARRAVRGDSLQLGDPLVDLGTLASLEHLTPVGMHRVDELTEPLRLGHAGGDETFRPFGAAPESPDAGELVYTSGRTVLTRRWVWRQGVDGSVTARPISRLAINIDLMPVICPERVTERVKELLRACRAEDVREHMLTSDRPEAVLTWR